MSTNKLYWITSRNDDEPKRFMNYCTKTIAQKHPNKPLILFVGGAMDEYYKPLLTGVYLPYSLKNAHRQDSIYAPHHARNNILKWIRHWQAHNQIICLVGHSWGCQTMMDVAHKISVDSTKKIHRFITLDPVSRRYINQRHQKPSSVDRWINIYLHRQHPKLERSNLIAYLGGRWDHRDNADENICLKEQFGEEVTHAKARLMFACVEKYIETL